MSNTPEAPLSAEDWDGVIEIDEESFVNLTGQPGTNTQIDYLYRDAANYKKGNSLILAGEITLEQLQKIQELLFDSENFLPERVGLNALNPWEWEDAYDDEIDHQLHEFELITLTTEAPTTTLTVADFVARFEAIRETGWQFHTEPDFAWDGSLAP